MKLLIIIERPSPKIVRAIEATAVWIESAFIEGRRWIEHPEDNGQGRNGNAFHQLTFASYGWTKDVIQHYCSIAQKLTGANIAAGAGCVNLLLRETDILLD